MKTELSKIAQDLEQGTITDNEARTLLLGLLGVSDCFSSSESEDLEDAMKIFDEMVIADMQAAISHIRNNR